VPAVFEYDGVDHNKPLTHARDVTRWRELRAAGFEVFPYTASDLFRSPQKMVVDYQRALGLPVDAHAVRGWLEEWKRSGFNR
jgi:very-short-patch-repair endonuclease